jgi:hypothetical protein
MPVINMAHLRVQGIDFAVFDADARSHMDRDRSRLLDRLTKCARSTGMRIQKSALAYQENGELRFFGTPDLVQFLVANPYIEWTHRLNVR